MYFVGIDISKYKHDCFITSSNNYIFILTYICTFFNDFYEWCYTFLNDFLTKCYIFYWIKTIFLYYVKIVDTKKIILYFIFLKVDTANFFYHFLFSRADIYLNSGTISCSIYINIYPIFNWKMFQFSKMCPFFPKLGKENRPLFPS